MQRIREANASLSQKETFLTGKGNRVRLEEALRTHARGIWFVHFHTVSLLAPVHRALALAYAKKLEGREATIAI